MKRTKVIKLIARILFVGLVFFTILFGTYQIFFDRAEALRWKCNWTDPCITKYQDCSDTLICTCKGDILPLCFIGEPEPEQ